MRTNDFLNERLDFLWDKYFSDIPKRNNVEIKFGKKAIKRLGSIRKITHKNGEFDTLIYINGYFKNLALPSFLIDATIVHELCHYAHGFSSPLPRLCRFPHRGDIVDRELKNRKLDELEAKEQEWLNKYWQKHIDSVLLQNS